MPSTTKWVLATQTGHRQYIFAAPRRVFDNRRLPMFSPNIEKAQQFEDEYEAVQFLKNCVLSGKIIKPEPYQTNVAAEKPVQFYLTPSN